MGLPPIRFAVALLSFWSAVMLAEASCPGSRPVTTLSTAGGASSYVLSPGLCPGGICADPQATSVSPQIEGWFWALGLGHPAPGVGIDSGSLAAPGFFNFYPGYPAWVDTNWNDARTDGCIDGATSEGPARATTTSSEESTTAAQEPSGPAPAATGACPAASASENGARPRALPRPFLVQ